MRVAARERGLELFRDADLHAVVFSLRDAWLHRIEYLENAQGLFAYRIAVTEFADQEVWRGFVAQLLASIQPRNHARVGAVSESSHGGALRGAPFGLDDERGILAAIGITGHSSDNSRRYIPCRRHDSESSDTTCRRSVAGADGLAL